MALSVGTGLENHEGSPDGDPFNLELPYNQLDPTAQQIREIMSEMAIERAMALIQSELSHPQTGDDRRLTLLWDQTEFTAFGMAIKSGAATVRGHATADVIDWLHADQVEFNLRVGDPAPNYPEGHEDLGINYDSIS